MNETHQRFLEAPTIHPDINQVLSLLYKALRSIPGNPLVGIYLYGSLAEGNFIPERSDIDILIITRDIPGAVLTEVLREIHEKLLKTHNKWARKLEVTFMPLMYLENFHLDLPPVPMINEGLFYAAQPGPEWILQRQTLRMDQGILIGPELSGMIEPAGEHQIRSAVKLLLDTWWKPMLRKPDRLNDPGYQPYAVLTMCRACYSLIYGETVSKTAAAQWALHHLPPRWKNLIQNALYWRDGDLVGDVPRTIEMIRWVQFVDSWQSQLIMESGRIAMEATVNMDEFDDFQLCFEILHKLCVEIPERPVGSAGNLNATEYFRNVISDWGWEIKSVEFPAVDWEPGTAFLRTMDGIETRLQVSPYSRGTNISARLESAASLEELHQKDITGNVVLLHGQIAREQIMPKNFIFYNPDHHRELITLLEKSNPAGLITASSKNSASAGGLYPYPMFEDGDFDIPSAYTTAEEGEKLLTYAGQQVDFRSESIRVPSFGFQLFCGRGKPGRPRIVISAHIDAKKGTPGALDNATGVAVLLLMAKALENYNGPYRIEILPINGEDYYAASGEMVFLKENQGNLDDIILNINIDGVGYHQGETALSFYGLDGELRKKMENIINEFPDMKIGEPWYQGDHAMFIQQGIRAAAVTSAWFLENLNEQDITHTSEDNLSIIDQEKVVSTARMLTQIVVALK
jgi:aminopeptidase YwaD